MKAFLLTVLGLLLLVMGAVGIFLPVWPTTPFVIAAAGCLSCSPKLRAKIIKIPFFREHIENYRNRKGLDRKTVIFSLGFLWGMLLISMAVTRKLWIVLALSSVGVAVTAHLLWMARPKE